MKNKIFFIFSLFPIYFLPVIHYGQLPNLGTASDFAVFTAIGAFNNLGATNVVGNIGTNVGLFTGFPPGIANGQIEVANTASGQAASDIETAYNSLNEYPCDTTIGTILGNGQVLTPYVYCLGAASTLNGDLTLDGQNNLESLFVFKIDGAFSTSLLANIILINSAQISNVFWQINGEFTLGDGSSFSGTLLVNGAISLLEGSFLYGRALSRSGAVSLHNNVVTLNQPLNPLPIELLSFMAYPAGDNVRIEWSTASETNNDYFTVQRSDNLISFENVLMLNGAGNSNSLLNYSAIDYKPFYNTTYYRLKQTDFDGQFSYSKIVEVNLKRSFDVNIYPNPFSEYITIIIDDASIIKRTEFMVFNIWGELSLIAVLENQYNTFKTSNLASGIYYYIVLNDNSIIQSGKLLSQ